jgi:hypothetical protein
VRKAHNPRKRGARLQGSFDDLVAQTTGTEAGYALWQDFMAAGGAEATFVWTGSGSKCNLEKKRVELDREETGDGLLRHFVHEVVHMREYLRRGRIDPTQHSRDGYLALTLGEEGRAEAAAMTVLMQRNWKDALTWPHISAALKQFEKRHPGVDVRQDWDAWRRSAAGYVAHKLSRDESPARGGGYDDHRREYAENWDRANPAPATGDFGYEQQLTSAAARLTVSGSSYGRVAISSQLEQAGYYASSPAPDPGRYRTR